MYYDYDFDEMIEDMDNESIYMEDSDFAEAFALKQAKEHRVNHCIGCDGEDCACCQYNPNL